MSKQENTETQTPKTEEEKTSENSKGEETPKNDLSKLEKENKSLRARMEHHKEKQKELEEKLEQLDGPTSQTDDSLSDVDKFVEMRRATEGLNSDEIGELKTRAKAENISLTEARENENFNLWLEAKRQKVAQDKKVPKPSTKQSLEGKSLSEIDVSQIKDIKNPDDRAEVLEKVGVFKEGELTQYRDKGKE